MQVLKDEIRKKIVKAGTELFLEVGFEKASMNKISHKAKVSRSNLYNYFTSKEDLFRYIINGTDVSLLKLFNGYFENQYKDMFPSKEFIENMSFSLSRFLFQYRTEVILLLEGSQGTKYDVMKSKMIEYMEMNFVADMGSGESSDDEEKFFLYVIASNLIEGIVKIIKKFEHESALEQNISRLIEYHIEGMKRFLL